MRRRYYLKMKLGEENKKNILLYKQTKNDKYKEKIILDNRKLSLVIFNKYKEMYKINSCISLQDLKEELIQEGDLALSIAIDEFDANKGIEFSTYAYTVIENAFYHYFSKNKNLIRLPKKTEILISKVKNAIIKLKELNKDYSNSNDIVNFLNDGTTESQVNLVIPLISNKSTKVITISDLLAINNNNNVIPEMFISEYDTPLEAYEKKEKKEILNKAINSLPLKHKCIFMDYTKNKFTFKEIAEKYSLTIEGARQVYISAIKKINNYIKLNK